MSLPSPTVVPCSLPGPGPSGSDWLRIGQLSVFLNIEGSRASISGGSTSDLFALALALPIAVLQVPVLMSGYPQVDRYLRGLEHLRASYVGSSRVRGPGSGPGRYTHRGLPDSRTDDPPRLPQRAASWRMR